MGLLESGKSHREIADICAVSIGTVTSTIYRVRNRQISIAGERQLTARQLEILSLVGVGLSDEQIGKQLFLSRSTVRHHLEAARERLCARTRIQCVMIAIAQELLILDYDGTLLVPHEHRVAA